MFYRAICVCFFGIFYALPAYAFTLSSRVEAITIPSVGATFQSVSFENTYANAVPVCTYNLPSTAAPTAVIRIQTISGGGMQIRIQQPPNSSTVTAGTVRCLIAELGVSVLPDGRRIEARTVLSTQTHGRNTANGFGTGSVSTMQNVSGLFSGFTSAIALGQVISFNDSDASIFHANDCETRANPAFFSNFADGICVTKHIGEDSGTRANETLGIIVIEQGTGSFDGIAYEADLGPDTVDGVGNNGVAYALSNSFEFSVATQSAEDGGDGGFAVFLGGGAVGGATLTVAIDEDVIADTERNHTSEQVSYFSVRRLPLFTALKTVDRIEIAETLTLNYEITLENTGQLNQTGVVVTDTLPDGSSGTVLGPVESLTADGIFEVGEVFIYSVSYPVTAANIALGVNIINNVSVTSDQYTSESLADETALASTTIVAGNSSIEITKTATVTGTTDEVVDVPVGTSITYTYVVENNGNQFISNISLADAHTGSGAPPLPSNETLTADNGVGNDSSDVVIDGSWDTLAPGDEVTFTATYIVTQSDIDTLQ